MKILNNKICHAVIALTTLIYSTSIFAITLNIKQFFEVAPDDTSLKMLKQLFGSVGNVLTGEPGLLNAMFKEFNNAMLALGTIVIMYTLFVSLLNTAQQGEFLGRKFESMWVPIRSVTGFALVIPTASGYSMIQIFMMWVIVQGIGAADTLWTSTLTYIEQSGAVVSAPTMVPPDAALDKSTNFYKGAICMHSKFYASLTKEQQKNPNAMSLDNLAPTIKHDLNNNQFMVEFRMPGETATIPDCGTIAWPDTTAAQGDVMNISLYQALSDAFAYNIPTLNDSAKILVFQGKDVVEAGINPLIATSEYLDNTLVIAQKQAQQDTGGGALSGWKDEASKFGWANAGAYYRTIAGGQEKNQDSLTDTYEKVTAIGAMPPAGWQREEVAANIAIAENLQTKAKQDKGLVPSTIPSPAAGGSPTSIMTTLILNTIRPYFYEGFSWMLTGNTDPTNPDSGFFADPTKDPVTKIQVLGNRLMSAIVIAWLIGFGILTIVALGAYVCSGQMPLGGMFRVMSMFLVVPAMFLFGILFVAALTMEVYVPMIPYIIFTFGVIGWLLAAIETILAAPIVALGIIHPEGHEVMGRAEPAVQLILNVFLRPVFMLFGLMVGMILSFVAVNFLNLMYAKVAIGTAMPDMPQMTMYIVVYVLLVIAILNRCFSLIHLIPDSVLRWIGNQMQFGQYAKGEEEVKGGFTGGAGMVKGAYDRTGGTVGGIAPGIKGRPKEPPPKGGGGGGGQA